MYLLGRHEIDRRIYRRCQFRDITNLGSYIPINIRAQYSKLFDFKFRNCNQETIKFTKIYTMYIIHTYFFY